VHLVQLVCREILEPLVLPDCRETLDGLDHQGLQVFLVGLAILDYWDLLV
jgi:hypothetical protein